MTKRDRVWLVGIVLKARFVQLAMNFSARTCYVLTELKNAAKALMIIPEKDEDCDFVQYHRDRPANFVWAGRVT